MAITSIMLKKLEVREKRYVIKDDKGLYLEVMPTGNTFWRLRYWINKKEFKLTLAGYPEMSLSEARKKRDALRVDIANGINPAIKKKLDKIRSQEDFYLEKVARDWAEKQTHRWTVGHKQTVLQRLEANIFPFLGTRPIGQITAPELLNVLQRIERRGALDLAMRVRNICSMLFRYAIASGLAERDPSADLKGALTPPPKNHFASITEPKKVGQLLRDIDSSDANFAVLCALKVAPYIFVRPGELRHAEWNEFDFEAREWRIPAEKTKMKTTHIVPLCSQVMEILLNLKSLASDSNYLFPSIRSTTSPMSENTIVVALRRLGYAKGEMTAHGFRSMASTLLNEQGWNRDAIERQLGHSERNGVRAAYNYAEFLPERRKMMQSWADYLDTLKSIL